MSNSLPRLTLIFGGASSGKSRFAEGLITASGRTQSYIATAQAYDAEMVAKIEKHRQDRGENWETHDAPLTAPDVLSKIQSENAVLIDCMTMWLSNVMLNDWDTSDLVEQMDNAIGDRSGPVVCVSNEVGMGIVPNTSLGRAFRDAQGQLNQQLAAKADLVVFVIAGLPVVIKGTLP